MPNTKTKYIDQWVRNLIKLVEKKDKQKATQLLDQILNLNETIISESMPKYKKSKHVMGNWIITEYHDGDVTIMGLAGNFELDLDGIMQNLGGSGPCIIPAWSDGEEIEFDPEIHALAISNYLEQTAESYENKSLPATASEDIDDDDLLAELD